GNFLVTAKNPAGSWSDPIWFSEVDGIDPSLFFDDDGKAYLVNNGDPEGESLYQGHKAVWFQEFDVKTNKLIGPRKVIRNGGHDITQKPIWIEGPHIYKIGEYYYLMTAEGGTSINHSQVIFRSKRVDGPYQPNPDNPILTQRDLPAERIYPVTNTGHADMVQTKNGKWYAVFLGCRPYNEQNYFNIGREVFLHPVKWENDWPEILEKGKVVPRILDLPNLSAKIEGANFKKQGNFSYIDSFKQAELSKEWFFLRTPKEKWYQPDKAGGIYINTRDVNLREFKQPSAIFRRQQHHEMTVETALVYIPKDSTDFAGLVLFQNEAFHLSLGITKINGQNMIVLQKAEKENDSIVRIILEKAKLPNTFDGRIELSATSKKGEFKFSYKLNDGDWVLLKDGISTEYLSTEKAGGFIGTVIGLYASSNEL
ncbi:MAG: family 43 glycosylhydrolase, partial [Bacteroidales bacterium]|nr:family 43 glycosylhydrolase [Bacteroidales bacterium]